MRTALFWIVTFLCLIFSYLLNRFGFIEEFKYKLFWDGLCCFAIISTYVTLMIDWITKK